MPSGRRSSITPRTRQSWTRSCPNSTRSRWTPTRQAELSRGKGGRRPPFPLPHSVRATEEAMDPRLFTAVGVVVGVPAVLVGYIYATELGLRLVPAVWRDRIRPWFWLAPALLLLAIFLILPTIGTIVRSFQNTAGTAFVGLENYTWFFGSDDALIALRNSALWVIFLTGFCVGLGLLI